MKKISQEVIDALNSGQRESGNLMEFLSVDIKLLLKNVLPEFSCPIFPGNFGVTKKYRLIGTELQKQFGFEIFEKLKAHKSDTIRTFACYLLGEQKISFVQKLKLVRPLADDNNAGVREWAWIVLRDDLILDLEDSIKLLVAWTSDPSDNIRRFASELTRPRGVWCKHITALRAQPWLGLPILLPLYSDPAKYVQLSVGNWLNDAGKDHPSWVIDLCREWQNNSSTAETNKICKRAMRNLSTL
ncbi:MAG: DNA alkylation repair protein [Rickettsiaceae bacterium]|nr:DNA alkylation repair protein [Rickettsiaceae bacterium]